MYKIAFFLAGLVTTVVSTPQVLAHHARAEIMQLAWCSSAGNAVPDAGIFAMHCAACPALLAGITAMTLSLALPVHRLSRRLVRVRLS